MADEGDVPFARRRLFEGRTLDLAFNRTMQDKRHGTDLGQLDCIAFQSDILGKTKGMGSGVPALETRPACSALSPVLKGLLQIPQDLLQRLSNSAFEEGT